MNANHKKIEICLITLKKYVASTKQAYDTSAPSTGPDTLGGKLRR